MLWRNVESGYGREVRVVHSTRVRKVRCEGTGGPVQWYGWYKTRSPCTHGTGAPDLCVSQSPEAMYVSWFFSLNNFICLNPYKIYVLLHLMW